MAVCADVDAGLIGMHELRLGELALRPLLEVIQPIIGFLVEVEDSAGTEWNVQLILEVIADALIGDQRVLGHIDRVGLQVETILNRSVHPLRKGSHKTIALIIFKDLCPVFGDKA